MNALLSAEHLDAIRAIVNAVAKISPLHLHWQWGHFAQCPFFCSGEVACDPYGPEPEIQHAPDCPVTLARALLADAHAPQPPRNGA